MNRYDALHRIAESGVIAILRAPGGDVVAIARALWDGGVRAVEITADTPGALHAIEALRSSLPEALVGVGTVLDAATARLALLAGAQFIVTPTLSEAVIHTANRYGTLVIPGTFTPTEILRAYEMGAPAVKVFPASVLGPDYIRHVRGPLPHIPMIPTGGVEVHNAAAFIAAGATAVGLGSSLVKRSDVQAGAWGAITERARAAVEAVRAARG